MDKIEKTKNDWKKELSSSYSFIKHPMKKNGKKFFISDFFKNASEEHKKDKELVALNFEKTGYTLEVPEEMINFNFIKSVFKIKESFKILYLPYQWKNNQEEKQYLKEILNIFKVKSQYTRCTNEYDILWSFEEGFWDDLNYTTQIKKFNYNVIDFSIITQLKKSKDETKINYLLELVGQIPYYLKYLTTKQKSLLSNENLVNYVKEYGLKSLTKEQKNIYEIVKEAFYNYNISYKEIDEKWKTPKILKDLLNNNKIWEAYRNGNQIMNLDELTPELLNDRDVVESCMSYGYNLIKLKNTKWFEDKELKKLALKNYPKFEIIEDCLNDKEMVTELLNSLHESSNPIAGIELFKQMVKVPKKLFEYKDLMKSYLSIKELKNTGNYIKIVPQAMEVIQDINHYNLDELIELISINEEVYKVLPIEMKEKWELIYPYYCRKGNIFFEFSENIKNAILAISDVGEDRLKQIKMYALEENLNRNLENKKVIKKLKV